MEKLEEHVKNAHESNNFDEKIEYKEDRKDDEIVRLKRELRWKDEKYRRLLDAYEKRVEKYRKKAEKVIEKLRNVEVERDGLKETYEVCKGEMERKMVENQEGMKKAVSKNEKLRKEYEDLEVEYNKNRMEVEKEKKERISESEEKMKRNGD